MEFIQDHIIELTLLQLIFINVFGYLYSRLIVTKSIFKHRSIQNSKRTDLKYLNSHLYLFIINVFTLMFFVFIGLYFFDTYIIDHSKSFSPFTPLFLLIILFFDDTFFYFLHRLMHENKYIYNKVHKIHHRANSPIPIDYIYVHPLEWMSGFIGPFIGILALGGVDIYTFWLYLFFRNFHELAIHSGIVTSRFSNIVPFYGTNEHHDLHHAKRNGNYASTFIVWDKVFKTKF